MNDIADVEERLYGADLDEFVKERAAAAKELRGEKRRGDAAVVAKLAKPSVAAWIVNRLARDMAKPVGALLEAGARLRDVQLGAGSAADLREASQAQEAALRAVMREAERIAAIARVGDVGHARPGARDAARRRARRRPGRARTPRRPRA